MHYYIARVARTCKICKVFKPASEFLEHCPGQCRRCQRDKDNARRRDNLERYREYDLRRWREPGPRREAMLRQSLKWSQENVEKRRAHRAVWKAIKAGTLKKPTRCEDCNRRAVLHGHHADYSKPLEVKWLCTPCHMKEHGRIRLGAVGSLPIRLPVRTDATQ